MENQSKNYLISSSRNILAAKFKGGRPQIESHSEKIWEFLWELTSHSPYTPVALGGTDLHF